MKVLINFLITFIIVFFVSCGGSESESEASKNSDNDFPNYVDSNNLRIFLPKK